MKKRMALQVRGHTKTWSFDLLEDPRHLQDWREDGLEIDEIVNTIPEWIANLGLTRAWCFVQDVLNFRNPWAKQ